MKRKIEGMITCSCGRKNHYWWSNIDQEFVCPGWKFRKSHSKDSHLPLGWYCGKEGHYQDRFTRKEYFEAEPNTINQKFITSFEEVKMPKCPKCATPMYVILSDEDMIQYRCGRCYKKIWRENPPGYKD